LQPTYYTARKPKRQSIKIGVPRPNRLWRKALRA